MEAGAPLPCRFRGLLYPRSLGRDRRALQAQQHSVQFDGRKDSRWRPVVRLRIHLAARRNSVLGSFRRALAARKRISLSRAAKGFATDEAAQELADVRPAKSERIIALAGARRVVNP